MEYCNEEIPVEYTTVIIDGKEYWSTADGHLVLKDGCKAVEAHLD